MSAQKLMLLTDIPYRKRKHFSLFIPSANDLIKGTKIHIVGDATHGFNVEFKRNFNLSVAAGDHNGDRIAFECLGDVPVELLVNEEGNTNERTASNELERLATQIILPEPSESVSARVNEVSWRVQFMRNLMLEASKPSCQL